MAQSHYELEVEAESSGHCNCCGETTKRIWGWLHTVEGTVAAYFWTWTENSPSHGAWIELIIGKWGDSAQTRDRSLALVEFYIFENGPAYRVTDPEVAKPALADHVLMRKDIIGTPLAQTMFDMLDVVWAEDTRLHELHHW
jgi:hypothetical protein